LLHALSAASLDIPPLADHREDIPDLVKAMATFLAESGEVQQYREFDVAALNAMRNAEWPGNLAQLKVAVKNLMLTTIGEKITLEEATRVLEQFAVPEPAAPVAAPLPLDMNMSLRDARDAFERIYFDYHIAKAGGNMSRVAEAVELERTHLYRKLKQLNIRAKQ
jgi:two-component system nitrogen regulation response regulator NtrX